MHDELEQLIARQALRVPSAALDARIGAALRNDRAPRWKLAAWSTAAAALAACLVLAATLAGPLRRPGPRDGSNAGPVSRSDTASEVRSGEFIRIDQVWSHVTPGALVVTEDDEPLRPLRVEFLRHTRWIDEANNVQIGLIEPDEQLVLISAPVQ
jgi:hypothetical protein